MSDWTLHLGEAEHPTTGLCLLPDASVDAMVTDPPAGIGFMGKEWDSPKGGRVSWISWLEGIMREALRAMKPGAHGLVWALPRTSHWTATALEQAGFEVRDVIHHHFGTGFPKSLDVSKAIDEAAGAEREVVGNGPHAGKRPYANKDTQGANFTDDAYVRPAGQPITAPATEAAKQWDGWGTALKPATEHWILVRKPLCGTVAANVQEFGTGGLNVDACRIATTDDLNGGAYSGEERKRDNYSASDAGAEVSLTRLRRGVGEYEQPEGRWPANLVLSHTEWCEPGACLPGCPVALLDAQSGISKDGVAVQRNGGGRRIGGAVAYSGYNDGKAPSDMGYGGSGGSSRFFFTAKPSTAEREADLALLPKRRAADLVDRREGSAGMSNPRAGAGRTSKGRANSHPTVKSVALMSWLVKLVTPPGGLVLDPFTGSGSTGVAALKLGFRFVGWELLEDHHRIASARIGAAVDGPLFARAAR